MEADEIGGRALGVNQISPDALLFLMEMRKRAETPQEADVITELRRLEEAGLVLQSRIRCRGPRKRLL